MKKPAFRGSNRFAFVIGLFWLSFGIASQGQISWNNVLGGNWNAATNWLPTHVPGPTNTAVVSLDGTYQVTVNSPVSVGSLDFSAGRGAQTLSIPSGTLTLASNSSFNSLCQLHLGTGSLVVEGGTTTFNGGGTSVDGTVTVGQGAVFDLAGSGVTWSGTLNASGSGQAVFSGNSLIGGNLLLKFTNGIAPSAGLQFSNVSFSGVITNGGVVDSTGTAVLINQSLFANSGLMEEGAVGGFGLNGFGGGTTAFYNLPGGICEFLTNSSVFQNNCCGTLFFNNQGLVWNNSTNDVSISIAFDNVNGAIRVDEGQLMLSGGGTSFNGTFAVASGAILDLTGGANPTWAGQISGSGGGAVLLKSGTLVASPSLTLAFTNDLFRWRGGAFAGVVTNLDIIVISGPNASILNNQALFYNAGTVEHSGAGGLGLNGFGGGTTAFYNLTGGIYEMTTDTSVFLNNCCGTVYFENQGLFKKSGGTNNSSVEIAFDNRGGSLEVDTGSLSLTGAGTSSNGTFAVASGAALDLTGGSNPTWAGQIGGSGGGAVLLSAGTVTASPSLLLAFTNELFNWSGGAFAGLVTNAGIVQIAGPDNSIMNNQALFYNEGLVEHTGSGGLGLNGFGGGTTAFFNLAGGTYEFLNTGSIFENNCCGTLFFSNQGLVRNNSTNDVSISIPFDNEDGVIEVDAGQLTLSGAGSSFNGTFAVASGAALDLTGGNGPTWAGQIGGSGQGRVLFKNGTVRAVPNLTLAFTNNFFHWSGGAFYGLVTNSGITLISGTNDSTLDNQSLFYNAGTVRHTGSGRLGVNGFGGGTTAFYNLPGATYQFTTDTSIFLQNCCGTVVFQNEGLLWKSGGTNATTISIPFSSQNGTVRVDNGQLVLSGAGTSDSGTFTVAFGASVDLTGANAPTWSGQLGGSGAGSVLLSTGRLNAVPDLTLDFTGDVFQWNGGAILGLVTNAGTVSISGINTSILNNQSLFYNAGLVVQSGAGGLGLNGFGGGTTAFYNLPGATYQFTADSDIFQNNCCGTLLFRNQGRLRKTGGTNTSTISIPFVNAGGSIDVASGTLSLGGSDYTQRGGNLTFTLGGQGAGESGQLTLAGTATLNGPLTVRLAQGYVPPVGTQFQILSAGTVAGAFSALNLPEGFLPTYTATNVSVTFTGFTVYSLSATENPAGAGSVSGTGQFLAGVTNTVTAAASYGYKFSNWTKNGVVVGTNSTLTVVVNNNIALTANFAPTNLTHVVTVASSPAAAVTIAGGGTYGNSQTAVITAPATATKGAYYYTFQYFTLNGEYLTSNNTVNTTFSTLNSGESHYVAVYTAQSLHPRLVNVSANYGDPVPKTTDFILTLQFDRTMQTAVRPLFILTNSAPGALRPRIGTNGQWTTTVYPNDTYSTPPITFGPGMDGTLQVFVYGAKDLAGTAMVETNAINLTVLSTPPIVNILGPTNGSMFTSTDTFSFSASATSIYGISDISLYEGSNLVTTAAGATVSASVSDLPRGSYALTAVATDNNRLSATSAVVSITVSLPGTTVIDFDALNAANGPVEHSPLINYLARYGVTIKGASSNTVLAVQDDQNIQGGTVTVASSGNNLLTQIGTNGAIFYTLSFSRPYASVSWKRTKLLAGTAGVLSPIWHAYAYDSNGVEVATAGESQINSLTNLPARRFTLSGANIMSVAFHGNNNIGALNTLPLDDLTLSTFAPGANIAISLAAGPNSVFTAPATITLNAAASEPGGALTRIDFYDGDILIGTTSGGADASELNASVTLTNLAAGNYTFTAVATDGTGATRSSTPLTVTIAPVSGVAVIDFDALDASSGAVGGAALSKYLAGFGVTLVNNTFGTRLEVLSAANLFGSDLAVPSTFPNLLTQVGVNLPVEFTMRFAKPLQSVGFTRVGLGAGAAGVSHPAWSAHAFNAAGAELESVGEPLIFSMEDVPARTFQLVGNNITRVQFDSDSQKTASFSAVLVDDIVLDANEVTNPLSISLNLLTRGPFTAPADIALSATVNDTIGTVVSVAFYDGADLIGMGTGGSYGFVWTNVLAGTNTLTAQLIDSTGYTIKSSPVRLVVNPGTGPSTTVLVDFDSLNASRAAVTGPALASYLKQNGMIATNLTAGTKLAVKNQALVAGGEAVVASSPSNILTQIGSDKPAVFTLEFSPLLTEFSFTRPELLANPFVTHPAWEARAYDSLGVLLAETGQGLISSYSNVPARSFTLRGAAGIAKIRINSESSLTTFGAVLMDDFILTSSATPLPPSVVLTNPLAGQIYTAPALVSLSAETFDPDGAIANVSFYASGGLIGSAAHSPFSILWTNSAVGNYTLTAVATDTLGLTRTSPPVKIVIQPQPDQFGILAQPVGAIQPVGGNMFFSVATTGTNQMTFQWNLGGMPLQGQNQSFLSLSQLGPDDGGEYTVVIQSDGESITSAPALLTVLYPPNITQAPQSQQVLIGANVTNVVGVSGGGPFSYQWLLNGTSIAGATNSSYVITAAQPFNSGDYQVSVANAVGVTNSAVAVVEVTVTGARALSANDFSDRISVNPLVGPVFGSNLGATREPGEPEADGKPGGVSIWYTWHANFTGVISLTTLGSSFDTLLAVYTGTNIAKLTPVAADDDSGGYFTSLVTFNCVQGVDYQIQVDGFRGATGTVVLGLPSGTGYRVLNPNSGDSIPIITQSPTNQVVSPGATVTLSVTATSSSPLTYQWFFENAPISGATSRSLVISSFQAGSVGHYYALAANAIGSLQSEIATVQLASQTGPSVEDKFGDAVDLSPSANKKEVARPLAGGDTRGFSVSQTFSTVGATKEPGEPGACGQAGGASEWYIYTTPVGGTFHVDTAGSDFNTVLGVFTSTSPAATFSTLVEDGCGFTTNYLQDGQPSINLPDVAAGTQFFITVDGYQGATGMAQLDIGIGQPPAIVTQPRSRPAAPGGTASFSVVAVGTTNFSYQWLFGGSPLAGATNAIFILTNAQDGSAGAYSVAVKNVIDVVTSQPAMLTLQSTPFIVSQPSNQTINIGQKSGFSVVAGGIAPLSYQWFADGRPVSGATTPSLSFASTPFGNSGSYTVVVSNSVGAVTSDVATLTVNETTRPTVAITSPASSETTESPTLTLAGTATDPVAVMSVQVLVNSNAVGVTGSNRWSSMVTLTPGANYITVQSYNASGLASAPASRSVFYLVTSSLTLQSGGPGSGRIIGETNQTVLVINKRYTVTAMPSPGCLFSNWIGGTAPGPFAVEGTNATLSFAMATNLVLQANFVTNPFPAVAGSYNGLFYPPSGVTEQSSGFVTATVDPNTGKYSAEISLDGGLYRFSGAFSLAGDTQTTVTRTGKSPVTVSLHLNLNVNPPDDQLIGSVSADDWMSALEARRAVFNGTTEKATNFAGRYTMIIPPGSGGPATSPGGYGFATITNNLAGISALAGYLGDSAPINEAVGISKDGSIPVYVRLYSGQGSLLGWIYFGNGPQTPSGTLSWIKTGSPAHTLYSGGFTNLDNTVIGSVYTPPPAAQFLQLTNGMLTIGGLVYTNVSIVANGFSYPADGNPPNPLAATFTPSTGVVTLTFRPTGSRTNFTAKGVVLQSQSAPAAAGWFIGTNQTGYFLLQP